jgi:hypothetical protein
MKKIVWVIGVGTFLVAAMYSIASLGRWEWTRALYFGLIALVAEVGLATGLVLRKLDQQGDGPARRSNVDPTVLTRLRETRPVSPNRFRWLDPRENQMNVFITMLVGGGVILSGLAWAVDKVASRTTTPAGEVRLARELGTITYPEGGLIVDGVTALAQDVPYCDDRQLRLLLRRSRQ